MANLKEVRNRISSVSSTKQITSAMKMVSASKLRRAQDAITRMRPYSNKLTEILQNLTASLDSSEGKYTQAREVKNLLIVPISSNRGLCGAFNSQVVKSVYRVIEKNADKKITVLSIGKKVEDQFKKTEYNIKGNILPRKLSEVYDNLNYEYVAEIAQKIMDAYNQKQFDQVFLVYNQFKNAAVQINTVEQFLPVLPPKIDKSVSSSRDYIFEPEKTQILEELIPKSLKTQLFKAILDSFASEHGARMTAMHKATDNASDMLKELKLSYNKARQAAITGEILEIVGGAEALNG